MRPVGAELMATFVHAGGIFSCSIRSRSAAVTLPPSARRQRKPRFGVPRPKIPYRFSRSTVVICDEGIPQDLSRIGTTMIELAAISRELGHSGGSKQGGDHSFRSGFYLFSTTSTSE